jgi:hypothetical protein
LPCRGEEQTSTAKKFNDSAEVDKRERRRKIWGHDPEIKLGSHEVKTARKQEENCEENISDHVVLFPATGFSLKQNSKKERAVDWIPPPFCRVLVLRE